MTWRSEVWCRYHLYRREASSRKTQNRHFSNISRTEDALCQIFINSVQDHSSYNHLANHLPVIRLSMLTFASSSLPYVSRIKLFGSVNSTINCIHFLLIVVLSVGSFSQIKFEIQSHFVCTGTVVYKQHPTQINKSYYILYEVAENCISRRRVLPFPYWVRPVSSTYSSRSLTLNSVPLQPPTHCLDFRLLQHDLCGISHFPLCSHHCFTALMLLMIMF